MIAVLIILVLVAKGVQAADATDTLILWERRGKDLVLRSRAEAVVCVALDSQGRIDCLQNSNEVVLPGAADGLPHTIHLLELGGATNRLEINRESDNASSTEPGATAEAVFIDPFYCTLRHFKNNTLYMSNPPGSERLELHTIEGERKLLNTDVPSGPWQITLQGLQPGTFYADAAVYSGTAAAAVTVVVAQQTVLFEAVLTAEELLAARHLHVHTSVPVPAVHAPAAVSSQQQQQQQQQRKIRLCFVGSLVLDGQKSIWLQQIAKLPRDR
jgi:hypothetical protein